jgi:hypothetical protein
MRGKGEIGKRVFIFEDTDQVKQNIVSNGSHVHILRC